MPAAPPSTSFLSKERVRSRVDQPAAGALVQLAGARCPVARGGSRASPEGHERGLEPAGTSRGTHKVVTCIAHLPVLALRPQLSHPPPPPAPGARWEVGPQVPNNVNQKQNKKTPPKPPRRPLLPPSQVGSLFCSAGCIFVLLVVTGVCLIPSVIEQQVVLRFAYVTTQPLGASPVKIGSVRTV